MAQEIRDAIKYHMQQACSLRLRGFKITANKHEQYAKQLEQYLRLAY